MGEPVPIALGKGSKKSAFGLEGAAEFVNAFLEEHGDGSKAGFTAYAINGNELFATLLSGDGIRAMLEMPDRLLVVADRLLFDVNPSGASALSVGGITGGTFGTEFVTMARNQATVPQAAIVVAGFYYIYQGGLLTEGADGDLPPPLCVMAKDGYFIFLIEDGRWWIVGPNTTEVDELLFATAESQPDNNVMGAVRGPDVILFGQKSTEFYQNTGAADFPFSRTHAINVGCYSAGSVQNIMARVNQRLVDSVIWAATDNQGAYAGVYILDGLTPLKISTAEIDRLVKAEEDPAAIRSQSWTEESVNGDTHVFYTITGTNFSRTFDSIVGEWHTRKSYGLERWRYSVHATFQGQHIWGDFETNKLYRSRADLLTEHGEPIGYSITLPTVHMFPFKFRVNAVHVDALTGVGAVSETDEDANPVLLMDYSKDGGASFGAARQVPLGAAAQRSVRVKERSFGIFNKNGVAFRFACSAAVLKGIQGVSIDADKLGA